MARKVFIINEPKGNRLALGKYGEIVSVCPGWIDNRDLSQALRTMMERLQSFEDGDYVVFGGHAKMNMVAFHEILTKHNVLRQLLPKKEGWFILSHDNREASDGKRREWYIPQ